MNVLHFVRIEQPYSDLHIFSMYIGVEQAKDLQYLCDPNFVAANCTLFWNPVSDVTLKEMRNTYM